MTLTGWNHKFLTSALSACPLSYVGRSGLFRTISLICLKLGTSSCTVKKYCLRYFNRWAHKGKAATALSKVEAGFNKPHQAALGWVNNNMLHKVYLLVQLCRLIYTLLQRLVDIVLKEIYLVKYVPK